MYKQITTHKELKAYAKDVIDKIGICSSIKEEHEEHWNMFIYLFERHNNYPEKFEGLKDIYIQYHPTYKKNLEVMILKDNGETDNVSVLKSCITGKGKRLITEAMRNAIVPQILSFRDKSKKHCVLCNSKEKIEIDHEKPQFIELHDIFLNSNLDKIPETFKEDEGHNKIFIEEDEEFKNRWISYHESNAKLRVLCFKCNNSRMKLVSSYKGK